jgi:tetratricopeptide (TPR) repeat protein
VAKIYEDLGRQEQAAIFRKLQLDNRDGFTLLNDARRELRLLRSQVDKDTGAKILDMLTKAAELIPQQYTERHAEIYRATGEILEIWGNTAEAIEYYEYALQKNPNVGVRRRLETLRKSSDGKGP